MKYLKKFDNLKESVGVPGGITNLSSKLFSSILEKLDSNEVNFNVKEGNPRKYKYETREIDMKFMLPLEGKINDYKVNEFNISIVIHEVKRPTDEVPEMTGAYFAPDVEINRKNFTMKYTSSNKIDIGIRLDFPWTNKITKKFWTEEVSKLIRESKSDVVSSLGHELMHSYDLAFIKGGTGFEESSDYQSVSNLRFGIPTVDKFFFYLYFMSRCENVVRSAEIASRMEAQGTTQENFLDFIQKNKTWTMLKDISKWTYTGFRQELIENVDKIKESLDNSNIDTDGLPDEEVVDMIEDLMINNIASAKAETLGLLLKDPKYSAFDNELSRMVAMLTGRQPEEDPDLEEKNRFFKSIIDKMKKNMKNTKHYFENQEKMFNFESNKLLKKISKLFSMATDTKTNTLHTKISNKKSSKTESVLNWEKYQDAIGVNPKISKKRFI